MLIMHIVGNRPQFIKLAPLSKEIQDRGYKDIILHTGQHYDKNMSDVFFEELGIDRPVENLEVGSGSHAEITARAIIGVEKACLKYKPSIVIIYGDTDTTLAAALACKKLNIPLAHVEAGPRTYHKENPEEMNRVVVDHISDMCFCPDKSSVRNLNKEGIVHNVWFSGDIMYDAFLQTEAKQKENLLEKYHLKKNDYVLMTWHRQENTESKERMEQILSFLEKVESKILYPMHPRTKKVLHEFGLWERLNNISNLKVIEPVGYVEMVYLQSNCKIILTDSGGLSKESVFAGVKCLFMVDLHVWPDLEAIGWVKHIYFDNEASVREALKDIMADKADRQTVDFYGDGYAAAKIVNCIEEYMDNFKSYED